MSQTISQSVISVDQNIGTGGIIQKGQTAVVHYTGKLDDEKGQQFDSSVDRGPFEFQEQMVIRGWGLGIFGDGVGIEPMRVGGKRTLTIPPELAYGQSGAGGLIPPNATLYFEVELLAIK